MALRWQKMFCIFPREVTAGGKAPKTSGRHLYTGRRTGSHHEAKTAGGCGGLAKTAGGCIIWRCAASTAPEEDSARAWHVDAKKRLKFWIRPARKFTHHRVLWSKLGRTQRGPSAESRPACRSPQPAPGRPRPG
jgi:hypothetical protein